MADRFSAGVQIPDMEMETPNNAKTQPGHIRLYSRRGRLYEKFPDDTEAELMGGPMEVGDLPLFIQDDQPVTTQQKYLWIQTNVDGDPEGFAFFFEDGS